MSRLLFVGSYIICRSRGGLSADEKKIYFVTFC